MKELTIEELGSVSGGSDVNDGSVQDVIEDGLMRMLIEQLTKDSSGGSAGSGSYEGPSNYPGEGLPPA